MIIRRHIFPGVGILPAMSLVLMFLAACWDEDSGSQGAPFETDEPNSCSSEGVKSSSSFFDTTKVDFVVQTVDDLDEECESPCEEGTTAYVREDDVVVVLQDGDWTVKEELESSSSVASSSGTEESSSSERKLVVSDKSITGVCQFVKGADIAVLELEGETLEETGARFDTKVSNDVGSYSVTGISLASKYVLVQAKGNYRNVVTGGKSKLSMTLKALADVSERDTVNVNLLTHLEYERVRSLVTAGSDFAAAKKQAESEIYGTFGFTTLAATDKYEGFEKLDIVSAGEGNAALLAVGVLLQGDLSDARLMLRLKSLVDDFAEDGCWDDSSAVATMADWAEQKDLGGELSYVRNNVGDWKIGEVPDFEQYVRMFWHKAYGLGPCDEAHRDSSVAITNKYSKNYGLNGIYSCREDVWAVASDSVKDVYGWTAGRDAEIKKGALTGENYVYEEFLGKWRKAVKRDTALKLGACTVNLNGKTGKCLEDGFIYLCSASGWVSLMDGWNWKYSKETRFNPDFDYGSMTDARDGKTYRTVVIDGIEWMAENLNYADSNATPSLLGNSWCYDNDEKKCEVAGRLYTWGAAVDSAKLAEDDLTICGKSEGCGIYRKIQGVCPAGWRLPFPEEWTSLRSIAGGGNGGNVLKSLSGWNGSNGSDALGFSLIPSGARAGEDFISAGDTAFYWVAYEKSGNESYSLNVYDNSSLNVYLWNKRNKSYGYSVRCVKDESMPESPSPITVADGTEGTFTDPRDNEEYKTVVIAGKEWMAENLRYAYRGKTKTLDSSSFCYQNSSCDKHGRLYTWSAAMDSAGVIEGNVANNCGNSSNCKARIPVRGVCPVGWRLPVAQEFDMLIALAGGSSDGALALKSTSGWGNDRNGNDSFGFNAWAPGYWNGVYNTFYNRSHDAYFLSASETSDSYVYGLYMSSDNDNVYMNQTLRKVDAYSVRCVRE